MNESQTKTEKDKTDASADRGDQAPCRDDKGEGRKGIKETVKAVSAAEDLSARRETERRNFPTPQTRLEHQSPVFVAFWIAGRHRTESSNAARS